MEFCIISPTAGLELFATRSKTHMTLAPQVVGDTEYLRFYIKQRDSGDFILMDNGVYESDYSEIRFLAALDTLKPNVAVLPDVICKSAESTKRSLDFYRKFGSQFPFVKWMFIPQGKTLTGWKASFQCYVDHMDPNNTWLGLTRFLPTHVCPNDPLIRVKLAKEIKDHFPQLPIHCMGMADGDVNELDLLAKQGLVYSIDSSAPVWRGWLGYPIKDRTAWRENDGPPVDFGATLDDAYLETARKNLEVCLDKCKPTQAVRS